MPISNDQRRSVDYRPKIRGFRRNPPLHESRLGNSVDGWSGREHVQRRIPFSNRRVMGAKVVQRLGHFDVSLLSIPRKQK
jgi:hypothetical protein